MTLDAIGIAGSALSVHRKWLDSVADNMANVNTATSTDGDAFRARYVIAREAEGVGGVMVAGAAFGDPQGRLAYQPDHPLADGDGMVRYPDIDLAAQMGALIMAQRGYQANAAVIDRARETYLAALEIGRR